jgi:hypothetical protein
MFTFAHGGRSMDRDNHERIIEGVVTEGNGGDQPGILQILRQESAERISRPLLRLSTPLRKWNVQN